MKKANEVDQAMADAAGSQCPETVELEVYLTEAPGKENITRHLKTCSRCQTRLEEIRANNALMDRIAGSRLVLDDVHQPSGLPRFDQLSTAIEGYKILGEIHRGGQGIVYRATQLATNRTVALKVLLAGAFATARQRRRFEREIELIAQLEHPNIVTVYDSGTTPDGCHYFAMQYVAGVPLDEWLRQRRSPKLSLPEFLRLFIKLCDGVSYAHQHGIIHRDLKPANIIVDPAGEPHILDFGLAKPMPDSQLGQQATVTLEGAFMGTLAYAAPEQTRGEPKLIDVRSDVYSLGVMLYEMLTGHFPYPVEGDLAEVLEAITTVAPKSPAEWRRLDGAQALPFGKLDNELETIVLKTLSKEKERRYQSAAALRDDIARYLSGEPVEAKRDSGWYILKKAVVRYRMRASIAAMFVVLLIAFSVTVFVMYQRASIEANKARQIKIFLEDTLSTVQPVEGGRDVSVRELLDEAVLWIDLALADQPEVRASIQTTIGNSYRSLGLFDKAEIQLQAALRTRLDLFGNEHLEIVRSLNLLAHLRREQGQLEEAERLFRTALAMRRKLVDDDKHDIYTLASLAQVRRAQNDYEDAERLLNESLAIRRRIFGDVHPETAMCHYSLALLAEDRGDLVRAERLHREALAMRRAVLHRHHPSLRNSLDALGTLLLHTGCPEDAEPLLRECLELRIETLPPDHWQIAQTQSALGESLAQLERYREAELLLLESWKLLEEDLGQADNRAQETLRRIVELYEAWGKPEQAARYRVLLR